MAARDPLPTDTLGALLEAHRETNALLREVIAALRRDPDAQALLVAVRRRFGSARFTTGALLELAAQEPNSPLGVALGEAVDLNAGPRAAATALGRLLSRTFGVETIAQAGGAKVYRLR